MKNHKNSIAFKTFKKPISKLNAEEKKEYQRIISNRCYHRDPKKYLDYQQEYKKKQKSKLSPDKLEHMRILNLLKNKFQKQNPNLYNTNRKMYHEKINEYISENYEVELQFRKFKKTEDYTNVLKDRQRSSAKKKYHTLSVYEKKLYNRERVCDKIKRNAIKSFVATNLNIEKLDAYEIKIKLGKRSIKLIEQLCKEACNNSQEKYVQFKMKIIGNDVIVIFYNNMRIMNKFKKSIAHLIDVYDDIKSNTKIKYKVN